MRNTDAHHAGCMGSKCHKSLYGCLAGRIDQHGHYRYGIYPSVQVVAAGRLVYRGDPSPIKYCISTTPEQRSAQTISPVKCPDQTGYADGYRFHDLFLFQSMNTIILASQSPRRKQLLEWAEIPFEIVVQESDEHFPPGLNPDEVAIYIARNKALAVQQKRGPGEIVLAADTIVVLNDHIIGKPVHREEAITILMALSGEKHKVITGVVIRKNETEIAFADTTEVEFHDLSTGEIEFYVDKYKPYDKAGAYAIQEWIGVVGIKWVKGDFYNVMGLPVSRVVQELKKLV